MEVSGVNSTNQTQSKREKPLKTCKARESFHTIHCYHSSPPSRTELSPDHASSSIELVKSASAGPWLHNYRVFGFYLGSVVYQQQYPWCTTLPGSRYTRWMARSSPSAAAGTYIKQDKPHWLPCQLVCGTTQRLSPMGLTWLTAAGNFALWAAESCLEHLWLDGP